MTRSEIFAATVARCAEALERGLEDAEILLRDLNATEAEISAAIGPVVTRAECWKRAAMSNCMPLCGGSRSVMNECTELALPRPHAASLGALKLAFSSTPHFLATSAAAAQVLRHYGGQIPYTIQRHPSGLLSFWQRPNSEWSAIAGVSGSAAAAVAANRTAKMKRFMFRLL
jgi:hypothetical protein